VGQCWKVQEAIHRFCQKVGTRLEKYVWTLLDMVLESVEELRRGDLKILNLEFQRNH
jgi:hypothetical protein